jgi:hypothetical protein
MRAGGLLEVQELTVRLPTAAGWVRPDRLLKFFACV